MKRLLAFFLRLTPFRIAMAMTVLVFSAAVVRPSFLEAIELKTLDAKFKTRGIRKGDERVAIIAIDEKSVNPKELGRWPWPRWYHAKLLDVLRDAGAKAVAFDIVFAEPDQNSELTKVQELRRLFHDLRLTEPPVLPALPPEFQMKVSDSVKPLSVAAARFYRELTESEARANSDQTLARAIAAFRDRTVLGYFFFFCGEEGHPCAPEAVTEDTDGLIASSKISQVITLGDEAPPDQSGAMQPNIAVLSRATDHSGHFSMQPDPEDGTIRWNHLVLRYKGDYYPSLGLKTAAVALGKPILVRVEHGLVTLVQVGDIKIPTDGSGRLLIDYAGPLSLRDRGDVTYKVYSFTDVMHGRIPKTELRDKIFLVGPTAIGIFDLRNTPFDPIYPGVGIHANVIDNILNQRFLQKPEWMKLYDLAIILLLGLILGIVLGRLRSFLGAAAAVTVAIAYYLFTQLAFEHWSIWLSTVYPELEVLLVFGSILTYKYMTEERQAKQIRGAFQSYVTPSVVETVLQDPSKLKLGGEMRDLTVMFSDVRGFTTISEKLTPEQLVDLLNAYLSRMTDIVFKYDGTLDKYIGDALMAIWGAPVAQEDHARRACFAAIEMIQVLENELKPRWEREGLKHIPAGQIPNLEIGIGLNSGNMSVGNMGSDQRFDYTVMGDNVNLASRLEGTNKEYGTKIIISEWTRERVGNGIVVRELDFVRVKGKKEPVRIFELIGKTGEVDAAILERIALFEEGLVAYRKAEWDLAATRWKRLLERFPQDETTRIFLARIAYYREHPVPPDWDGVHVMKSK